jgi:hypothetical protein
MPRFVILTHEQSNGTHFDFMLEAGGVLKTWSLPLPPVADVEIRCTALPEHRTAYLDYEGPVSGDRGTVVRWDQGIYTPLRTDDSDWLVEIAGERVSGTVTLRCHDEIEKQWIFLLAAPGNQ